MTADPRIAEIAKALDAWEFDSFGNTREEHWRAAADMVLRIADAAYEQVGWRARHEWPGAEPSPWGYTEERVAVSNPRWFVQEPIFVRRAT